jgi:hypothetical protein
MPVPRWVDLDMSGFDATAAESLRVNIDLLLQCRSVRQPLQLRLRIDRVALRSHRARRLPLKLFRGPVRTLARVEEGERHGGRERGVGSVKRRVSNKIGHAAITGFPNRSFFPGTPGRTRTCDQRLRRARPIVVSQPFSVVFRVVCPRCVHGRLPRLAPSAGRLLAGRPRRSTLPEVTTPTLLSAADLTAALEALAVELSATGRQ